MKHIKSILEGIVSQGRLVGSRGSSFRASSSSDATGRHDHGIDIGAKRNYDHEKAAKEKADSRASERERAVEKRNREAEQRKKETAKMASEENISEAKGKFVYDKPLKAHVAAMDKHSTDALKGMHDRWASDHKDMKSNPAHSEKLLAAHHILKNRGVSVPDLPQHKNLGMTRRFTTEEAESAGTKARVKIKNVARPGDPEPTSEKSTLSKTGSIKTKIVEEKPTMSLPNFGLPASLISATRQIVEKKNDDNGNGDAKKMEGGKTAVIIDPETDDKINEGEPKKKHTTPKSAGEKKLAALAHPKDKITHKDVLVGRGVVKEEEVEEAIKPYVSFTAARPGRPPSATVMGPNEKPHKTFSKTEHGSEYKQKALDYFKKHGSKLKEEEEQHIDERERSQDELVKKWANHANQAYLAKRSAKIAKGDAIKSKNPMDHDIAKGYERKSELHTKAQAAAGRRIKEEEEIEEKTLYGTPDEHKRKLDRLAKQEKKLPPGISPARKALAIKKQKLQKAHAASMGMNKEEVEQIDELSPGTLGKYAVKVASLPPEKVKPSREAGIEKATKKLRGMKEELSAEEIERIEAIAAQLDEAKPTVVSAPIRGANQDQAGHGTKSAVADYTISDSKKVKVKEEVELEEGRGRPRKNPLPAGQEPAGDDTHKHPMQQLEKISHAIEGNEPQFEHKDGTKSKVGKHLAKHIVAIHNSMRTSQEKDNFAQKVHANRDSMKSEVSKHF